MCVKKCFLNIIVLTFFLQSIPCHAAKSRILVNATVNSFGTYSTEGTLSSKVEEAGEVSLGSITINGIYNGPYPWHMRLYTDNKNFQGIAGSFYKSSDQQGLVSKDGKYTIALFVNCENFGEEFFRVPDINQSNYRLYKPSSDPVKLEHDERIIMGIDPRNAMWVSGEDNILFTDDDNPKGDITIPAPFELRFRTQTDASSVQGEYSANLYIELVPAP